MAELKARHAYGTSANLQAALAAGTIDAYDILFPDDDTDPKIGWVDKNGNAVVISQDEYVQVVDALPSSGEEGVIYIFGEEGYVWSGTEFVSISKAADLSALEAEIATKVDEATVDTKIETALSSLSVDVVEF